MALHRFAGKGLVSANLSAVPTETMASYWEAGIIHYCHPRVGGDPFSRRQSKWIPACAGMTLEIDGFRQSLFLTCAKQGKSAFRWGKARPIVGLGEIMRSPEIDEEPLTKGVYTTGPAKPAVTDSPEIGEEPTKGPC